MEEDFPKMELSGSTSIFRIRIPTFTNKALYDPTIDLDLSGVELDEETDDDNDDDDEDNPNGSTAFTGSPLLTALLGLITCSTFF